LISFVDEPHSAIEGPVQGEIVNLTDKRAENSRAAQLELLALKRLDDQVRRLERTAQGLSVESFIAAEREALPSLEADRCSAGNGTWLIPEPTAPDVADGATNPIAGESARRSISATGVNLPPPGQAPAYLGAALSCRAASKVTPIRFCWIHTILHSRTEESLAITRRKCAGTKAGFSTSMAAPSGEMFRTMHLITEPPDDT
jgi:hypothetical protein